MAGRTVRVGLHVCQCCDVFCYVGTLSSRCRAFLFVAFSEAKQRYAVAMIGSRLLREYEVWIYRYGDALDQQCASPFARLFEIEPPELVLKTAKRLKCFKRSFCIFAHER